jgi:hypothetical protein
MPACLRRSRLVQESSSPTPHALVDVAAGYVSVAQDHGQGLMAAYTLDSRERDVGLDQPGDGRMVHRVGNLKRRIEASPPDCPPEWLDRFAPGNGAQD